MSNNGGTLKSFFPNSKKHTRGNKYEIWSMNEKDKGFSFLWTLPHKIEKPLRKIKFFGCSLGSYKLFFPNCYFNPFGVPFHNLIFSLKINCVVKVAQLGSLFKCIIYMLVAWKWMKCATVKGFDRFY